VSVFKLENNINIFIIIIIIKLRWGMAEAEKNQMLYEEDEIDLIELCEI